MYHLIVNANLLAKNLIKTKDGIVISVDWNVKNQ